MKNRNPERRDFHLTEIRAEDGDADGRKRIVGHAAVFDTPTMIGEPEWGGFVEIIRPGAFKKTIAEGDVVSLYDHDSGKPLGRQSNGRLKLWEDETGLATENFFEEPMATWERDAYVSVQNRNIQGQSFGFRVIKEDWSDEGKLREIREIALQHTSYVTFPQYPTTDAEARAVVDAVNLYRVAHDNGDTREPVQADHSRAMAMAAARARQRQIILGRIRP